MILFFLFLAIPAEALIITSPIVKQGQCLYLSVASIESQAEVQAEFLGQKVKCFPNGDMYQAVIGVPCEQKLGFCTLTISAKKAGQVHQEQATIKVQRNPFPTTSFWLKPAKKKLLARDLTAEEWGRIERVLVKESGQCFWLEPFDMPVAGRQSMLFGTRERINGVKRGQHRGLDLAVFTGTEVVAPNPGVVVFAEGLKVFGGTVVLDHGQGVNTLYFHLSKIKVSPGQSVAKGEVIALSGNTGASSGPHLHWGVSVHNLRVDPLQWTKGLI